MKSDLEIFTETWELYNQQESPRWGWWYRDEAHNNLCIEGCMLKVMGYNEEEVKEDCQKNDDEKEISILNSFRESSAYKKLQNIFDTHDLYMINDRPNEVKEGLLKAIQNEEMD